MMSVGIGTISKGLLQQAIESVTNDNNAQRRPGFLNALKGPQTPTDWLDFLRNSGELDRGAEHYVRNTWQKFWQRYPVEPIMRQSLIEAIELADNLTTDPKNPMPIECHWIWTDDPDKFEVFITHNARQVTRILLTPRPPTNPALPLIALAPYFVVKPRIYLNTEQEQELPRDPEAPGAIVRKEDSVIQAFLKMPRDPGAPWVTVQLKAQH